MARKKKECAYRADCVIISSGVSPPTLSDLQLLLPGMIALFSGSRSYEEVEKVTEKCRRFGGELQLDLSSCEKKRRFPHAGFVPTKDYSSR